MRHRVLTMIIGFVAAVAVGCSSSTPAQPAADRAVGSDQEWSTEQTILRTVLIEDALEAELTRKQAACTIDKTLATSGIELARLEGVDLSARTPSGVSSELASALADALIECGPALAQYLGVDIPGALDIPDTHAVQRDCLTNAYAEGWRTAYQRRFRGTPNDADPALPDISDSTKGMIAGCEAAGAVLLGASNSGHLDTFALSTLEWACLDVRLSPDAFIDAFPFPDEPGDALDRLGNDILADVAYCESFVAGGDGGGSAPSGADTAG